MKQALRKWLIKFLFNKPIKKFSDKHIDKHNSDFIGYLYDLLEKDEKRMLDSKEGLHGYYDVDIEINRSFKQEIKEYVRN